MRLLHIPQRVSAEFDGEVRIRGVSFIYWGSPHFMENE